MVFYCKIVAFIFSTLLFWQSLANYYEITKIGKKRACLISKVLLNDRRVVSVALKNLDKSGLKIIDILLFRNF